MHFGGDSELMAPGGKKERTASAKTGNKRGPGRPRGPVSDADKKKQKNQKDRDNRQKKKFEFEVREAFCKRAENNGQFRAFEEEYKRTQESSTKDETNVEMLTGNQAGYCEGELRSIPTGTTPLSAGAMNSTATAVEKTGIEEDEADQSSDEGVQLQMLLENFSRDPLVTLEEHFLKLQDVQTNHTGLESAPGVNSSSVREVETLFDRAVELKRNREKAKPATAYSTSPSGFMVAYDNEASSSRAPPQVALNFTDDERGLGYKKEASVYNLVELYGKLKDVKRREKEAIAASIDAERTFKEKKEKADNLKEQVKGMKEGFSKIKAELEEKGKIFQDAHVLKMIEAVMLGSNLMKNLLQYIPYGSEFLNLNLLDAIKVCPPLQNQFNEGLTLIGKGHPVNDKVVIQSDDPPVVVPRSFFSFYEFVNNSGEFAHNGSAPLEGDANIAANNPQFQAGNARANNVEQEYDANYQRRDEDTGADNLKWTWQHGHDGGEDP